MLLIGPILAGFAPNIWDEHIYTAMWISTSISPSLPPNIFIHSLLFTVYSFFFLTEEQSYTKSLNWPDYAIQISGRASAATPVTASKLLQGNYPVQKRTQKKEDIIKALFDACYRSKKIDTEDRIRLGLEVKLMFGWSYEYKRLVLIMFVLVVKWERINATMYHVRIETCERTRLCVKV